MIDRNHPAVEAAVLEYLNAPPGTHVHDAMAAALTEALRILTDPSFDAHNLRGTPAGKQLLAEGWDERHKARPDYSQGRDDDCMGWEDCHCGRYVNPYHP